MIYAFDTFYSEDFAKTACVAFADWGSKQAAKVYTSIKKNVAAYEPGSFYKRELPCILELIPKLNLKQDDIIIIDGFVFLDENLKKGLGAHLYYELDQKVAIIGVAKTSFFNNEKVSKQVFRGKSQKPLHVTAIGYDMHMAATNVAQMAGPYRIPDLLKLVDQESRRNE